MRLGPRSQLVREIIQEKHVKTVSANATTKIIVPLVPPDLRAHQVPTVKMVLLENPALKVLRVLVDQCLLRHQLNVRNVLPDLQVK